MTSAVPRPDPDAGDNQVYLRGVLGAPPETRTLPSGDELSIFRLTVRREPVRGRPSRTQVDSIDCRTSSAAVRRALGRVNSGDSLELSGALRRRFWRAAGGPASRYEVEVSRLRRLRPDASGLRPDRKSGA